MTRVWRLLIVIPLVLCGCGVSDIETRMQGKCRELFYEAGSAKALVIERVQLQSGAYYYRYQAYDNYQDICGE